MARDRRKHARRTTVPACPLPAIVAGLLAAGAIAAGGCATGPPATGSASPAEIGPPAPGAPGPGTLATDGDVDDNAPRTIAGLRTVRVRFEGPPGRVPLAMQRLVDGGKASPLDATPDTPKDIPRALRDAGLRAYALEPGAAERLLGEAPPTGAIETGWSGSLPRWSPLLGTAFGPSPRLHDGGGSGPVPAGRLRLMARSWVEPGVRPGLPIAARPGADWAALAEAHRSGADTPPPTDPIGLDDPTEHGPMPEEGETESDGDDGPAPPQTQSGDRVPIAGPDEPLRDTIGSVLLGLSPDGARGGLVLIAAPDRRPPPWTRGRR